MHTIIEAIQFGIIKRNESVSEDQVIGKFEFISHRETLNVYYQFLTEKSVFPISKGKIEKNR